MWCGVCVSEWRGGEDYVCNGAYSCYVQVVAENGLLEARQQFEAHLSELRSKAELLSSHLEKEAAQRKSTEEEVRGEGGGEG